MTSISVIIPTYNSAATIEEALSSVVKQTYLSQPAPHSSTSDVGSAPRTQIEIIVVDDASKDGTAEAVRAKCKVKSEREEDTASGATPRTLNLAPYTFNGIPLRVLTLERNSGPAATRNKGIAAANGEWIAFLDGDDAWMPEKLRIQLEAAAQQPNVELWCGDVAAMPAMQYGEEEDFSQEGREERDGSLTQQPNNSTAQQLYKMLTLNDFALGNPVATSTVMVKRSVLEDVGGFDEQFRGPEDYDLWMRIAGRKPETGNLSSEGGSASGGKQEDSANIDQTAGMNQHSSGRRHEPTSQQLGAIAKIGAPLARYRSESGSLSMDDRTFLPEVMKVLDKAFAEGGALSELQHMQATARARQYWHASWMAFTRGDRRQGLRYLLKARGSIPVVKLAKRMLRYAVGRCP